MFFKDELENVKTIMPYLPFKKIPILRGKQRSFAQSGLGD
jgi:hypothetical protein